MEDMRTQIELRVIAAQLCDWLKHEDGIIFDSSLCTQERVLRFQTPLLTEIFPNAGRQTGAWKNGCFFMYEIYNGANEFKITCSVSLTGLSKKQHDKCLKLLESSGVEETSVKGLCFVKEWVYPDAPGKLEKIMKALEDFSEVEMPYFEAELSRWKDDHKYQIKSFPSISQVAISREDLPEELLVEGGMKDILTNKYERNLTARKKCIAYWGTACQICGIDFGVVYGAEFAGKIHVHHKVPLCEIKKDYVVDPVNDLIPVCPNCHMILHSKLDGVYTVDEVKEMIKS